MPCPTRHDTLNSMSDVRRETTLHLLFLQGSQAAIHTVMLDQPTYYGSNICEAAVGAGLRARPLRRVFFHYQGEVAGVRKAESVWQLDPLDDAGLDWRDVADLTERERGWVDIARRPPSNVPWMHVGWFAGALAWVDNELAAQGWRRHGDPRVLKHWQISALWEVETTHGRVFFKAVPEFFVREVKVTPPLARELEGAAPPVLAADEERGFLLLADAGAVVDEAEFDLNALMRHVARLQRESVPLLSEWLSRWSLHTRGPEYVLSWLDHLLSDECLLLGHEDGFTPQEATKLRARRPALEGALHRLSASPLPRTLGHGDLHGGNVVQWDGQFTILDWSDVCLTHPFMDINPAYFLPNPWENSLSPDQERVNAATDAYLQGWTDFAPLDDLRALLRDGLKAAELYRALSYVDGLQGAVEDKTEWHGTHLIHLRKVLEMVVGQD